MMSILIDKQCLFEYYLMLSWLVYLTIVSARLTCEDVCDLTETCTSNPHAHGTYCKTWQRPSVCFGMYVKPIARFPFISVCYQPNDSTCDDLNYEPLRCENEIISDEIADALSGKTAPTDEVVSDVAHEPVTDIEAESVDEQSQLTPEEISCIAQCTKAPAANDFGISTGGEGTTRLAEADECDNICTNLDECNNDPLQARSYCKTWNSPKVCFGLYHRQEGGFCFKPNNPSCDDANLPPVLC